MAKSYYERLAYSDVDPQRVGNEAHYLSQSPNAEKYAAALDRADPAKVEETLAKVRSKFNETASKSGNTPGQWAKSESWGLWDIGKQLHLNEEAQATGGASANPNYRTANPLTDPQLQDEIAARMVGFDSSTSRGEGRMASHEYTALGKRYMEGAGVPHSITEGPAAGGGPPPAPAPAPPPPEPAPIETKTPEQKRAEVLAQTGDKSKVANTDVMHQRKVRDYLANRNAATGNNGNVVIPPEVVRSLRWMGYQVPEPDMAGSTLPDGTKEPGWHSKSNRNSIDEMADHFGARDLEEELRQNQSRKAQAEVAKSREAKAKASGAPQAAAPAPAPPPPAPAPAAPEPKMITYAEQLAQIEEAQGVGAAKNAKPAFAPVRPTPRLSMLPAGQARRFGSERYASAPAPPPPAPAPAAPAATPFDLGSPNRMPVTPEPGALGSAPTNQPSAPPPTPSPPTTPTPAAQAASSATTTTAGTATPAAAPSATPATPSQAAASTASAAPTPSAAPAGAPPPRPPPPPSAGATPPPASPPPPPRPTVTTAKDAMKRGQRVQGPTGVRNRGSNIHNNSFWQRELHLSSQGLIGGLASVANDFGLNRRVASYADKKASTYTDSWFGKSLSGSGYVHPVEEAGQVIWKSAKTLDAAERGWAQHISSTAQNSTGIMGALTKSRAFIHGTVLGGQGSMANKALTALGGAGSTIAPLMAAGFAINDARQGYREGGILGAASGAATGYLTGALVNKVISGVLLNPAAGLIGGGLLAATMYTTHKIFDVRNKGVEYLRMGRMQGLTWDKGPSPGMSGANIASMRQRSLNAMENSRFNAMKAIGNESYMMSAPKARYSNSTAINSIAPMLSY